MIFAKKIILLVFLLTVGCGFKDLPKPLADTDSDSFELTDLYLRHDGSKPHIYYKLIQASSPDSFVSIKLSALIRDIDCDLCKPVTESIRSFDKFYKKRALDNKLVIEKIAEDYLIEEYKLFGWYVSFSDSIRSTVKFVRYLENPIYFKPFVEVDNVHLKWKVPESVLRFRVIESGIVKSSGVTKVIVFLNDEEIDQIERDGKFRLNLSGSYKIQFEDNIGNRSRFSNSIQFDP